MMMLIFGVVLSPQMQKARLERCEAAIEARLHRRERSARDDGNLFERELFVEAEREHLAIARLQRQHDRGELSGILATLELLERRRAFLRDLERALIFAALAHLIERRHGALAREVDDEVAGDGEDPGVEAGFAVVLRSALEDTNPDLLEEVFGHLALVRQEHEIAHEAVLISLDQTIEQLRILPFQAASDRSVLTLDLPDSFGSKSGGGLHVL